MRGISGETVLTRAKNEVPSTWPSSRKFINKVLPQKEEIASLRFSDGHV